MGRLARMRDRGAHFLWEHWSWVRFSPFAVLAFGVFIALDDTWPKNDEIAVTILWIAIAGFSALFAELMRRRTLRLARIAREELSPRDPLRILTETSHHTTFKTELVHLLFFVLGLAIFILPEWIVPVVARTDIMLGQYLLFMIILKTWLSSREVTDHMSDMADREATERRVRHDAQEIIEKRSKQMGGNNQA